MRSFLGYLRRGIATRIDFTNPPILQSSHLVPRVLEEVHYTSKIKYPHLSTLGKFSRLLGGLRPGELTIFSGPTGCGKTTILSQMTVDYAEQSVGVLWGSFEIKNTRLAQVMMQQLVNSPLIGERGVNEEALNRGCRALSGLPIQFMQFFGSTDMNMVLDTMEASMKGDRAPPPDLIILDNLQFMLSGQGNSSLDKWELMDRAIANLRKFCNHFATHVILVMHPRKEADETVLGLASVSGTAKATQEADNVIIVQKIGERRSLELKKNRYFGDLGSVSIGFEPNARMIYEIEKPANKSTEVKQEQLLAPQS